MRKRILIVVAVAVGSVAAFGLGVFVERQYQLATIRGAEAFARDLTGVDDPVPLAPRWDEWQYPGAKSNGNIQGTSLRLMGELVRPAGHYVVLVTADAFEDVARFYAEKASFKAPDAVAKSRLAVSSEGTLQGESNHVLDDFIATTDSQTPRPVRTKCLIRRCPSYDLSVLITRADSETFTHVVLLYDPKTETAGEQR